MIGLYLYDVHGGYVSSMYVARFELQTFGYKLIWYAYDDAGTCVSRFPASHYHVEGSPDNPNIYKILRKQVDENDEQEF